MGHDESLGSIGGALAALAATPGDHLLPRGTIVDGQYRIVRVIGEGGMGVVYLARDEKLDRDIAIKVARVASADLVRLGREAIALARLSHPNVVVIYQVGEVRGCAYVAMEYVAGGTARSWCAERSARAKLALYLAAGEGLAAAHAAGLVHRDIKPDNVLVGTDDRPRVADFGLALVEGERDATAGTPAYMAPEQRDGGDVDARSDQYAWCASLWEALSGERFDLATPPSSDVPRHVTAALRRGLEADPAHRWPSLAALLVELRRDPHRRRRALVGGGAVTLALAAAIAIPLAARPAVEDCGAGELAWSPERAVAVRAALTGAAPEAWVERTAARTVARLDTWAHSWHADHRAVCLAGRGAWSTALHDRGVECLARRARELDASAAVLATPAPALAGHADSIVDQLGAPERCLDPEYLLASVRPPDDFARAGAVRSEQAELAKVRSFIAAGQTDRARALATAILPRATALAYAPLVAQARGALGAVLAQAGANDAGQVELHDAYFIARAARDFETATSIASDLAYLLLRMSRDVEAGDYAKLADADAVMAATPLATARAHAALSAVAADRGDLALAVAEADRYLAIVGTIDRDAIPRGLRTRGHAHALAGAFDRALADFDAAKTAIEAKYGAVHGEIGLLETERALVLYKLRRYDEAIAACRQAADIGRATDGPNGNVELNAIAMLANALIGAKRYDEALATFDRAIAADTARDGATGYNVGSDLANKADLLSRMTRLDEALATYARATAIFTGITGADGVDVGNMEFNAARGLFHEDPPHHAAHLALAAEHATRAVAILAKHPDFVAYPLALILRGEIAVEQRDFDHAEQWVTDGLAKLDPNNADPGWRGLGELQLAHVALARADRPSARAHATSAVTAFRLVADDYASQLDEAQRFLGQLK